MKTFDVLYKRTKTGAIQSWKVEVIVMDDHCVIRKTSGQLGTENPIVHNETIKAGKRNLTPRGQAEFQAESDHKKKKDEGYKSRQDLGIDISGDLMHYSINHVHYKTLTEALNAVLPQFNTDASGNLKPMKAPTKPWKPGMKMKGPQQIEPKMDGLRATLVVERAGPDMTAKFLSSGGKEYPAVHHLVTEFLENYTGHDPIILDGELYCHGMLLEEINSAVRKEKESTKSICFHIFDLPELLETEQSDRTRLVGEVISRINSPKFPTLNSQLIYTEKQVIEFHNECVEQGYEGAMLKDPEGTYQPGQRSSFWTKVKMFDDTEFDVIDMKLGQRDEDLIVTCACKDGEFDVKMTGTRAIKAEQWENRLNIIGQKQLTVKHFGYSKYGIPNLPTGKAFRDKE